MSVVRLRRGTGAAVSFGIGRQRESKRECERSRGRNETAGVSTSARLSEADLEGLRISKNVVVTMLMKLRVRDRAAASDR